LQAPVGYDQYGYAYRDKTGDKVHCGRPTPYADPFGSGDIIGVYITLSQTTPVFELRKRRERFLCTFRGQLYFEEKGHIEPDPTRSVANTISFSKNGVFQGIAFENVIDGPHYPSLSLYRGCRITVNFGPTFKYPSVGNNIRPYSDRYFDAAVENILHDLVDALEMESKMDSKFHG
jgi:Set1/Ash2 histone methyltransferase complex subunit ASH2